MVQQEYGVIGRALHRRHGSVHEDMEGSMHAHANTACHTCLRVPKTCKIIGGVLNQTPKRTHQTAMLFLWEII